MGIWLFFNLLFHEKKYGVGIGRANILEAIDRFGSISAAGVAVDTTLLRCGVSFAISTRCATNRLLERDEAAEPEGPSLRP